MRRKFTDIALVLAILNLAFTGCTPQQKIPLNDLRDDILPAFFTDDAIAEIGQVPMYSGSINEYWALSVGNDWGSRALAAVYGYGCERQVLMPYSLDEPHENWLDLLTFHEYIHQADYEGLLSRELFASRLERMRDDPDYADVADALDNLLASLTADPLGELLYTYDSGLTREAMAYLIQYWADGCFDLPDYMLEVYDGVVLPDPASRTDDVDDCYYFWAGYKSDGARAQRCACPAM